MLSTTSCPARQRTELLQLFFQFLQMLGAHRLFTQLGDDLLQTTVQGLNLHLHRTPFFACPLAVFFPHIQPQDAAQDALAVIRALLGKLVRLALQKKRGIDKGVVIQA